MRSQRWMVVLWACFLARLLFYSAMLPLWEGYDEWAHFAVLRQMANTGHLLVARDAPVPRDVEASLQLAPVPWELRTYAPPSVTRDRYWELSRDERSRRELALRSMPAEWGRENGAGGLTAYEALQPPLYYWLMTPVLMVCRGLGGGLLAQVLALRLAGSLIASFTVPLVFLIGLEVLGDRRIAVAAAAIVVVMPGLALDVARVGNDCLAVVLFTLLTWLALRPQQTLAAGLVLGLGLLTKAYFLTAIPALLGVWLVQRVRPAAMAKAMAIGFVLAGWWYAHNLATTGTLAGLSESVMTRGVSPGEMLRAAGGINWLKAIDAILLSHLYFGGWSSLTVRSWMYHLFYAGILVAGVGLARQLRRPGILPLLLVYVLFWAGQLYNVVLLYISKGLAGSMGWYMYALVGAEVVLCVAAWKLLAPVGACLFALLDLYTVHAVAIPYYTGMIRHRTDGSLEALHWVGLHRVGIGGAAARLAEFVPSPLLAALWLLYLVGTVGALACACARECDGGAKTKA